MTESVKICHAFHVHSSAGFDFLARTLPPCTGPKAEVPDGPKEQKEKPLRRLPLVVSSRQAGMCHMCHMCHMCEHALFDVSPRHRRTSSQASSKATASRSRRKSVARLKEKSLSR